MSACPVGYFGQDCSETCINSYTGDGCNDISGSCDYGLILSCILKNLTVIIQTFKKSVKTLFHSRR